MYAHMSKICFFMYVDTSFCRADLREPLWHPLAVARFRKLGFESAQRKLKIVEAPKKWIEALKIWMKRGKHGIVFFMIFLDFLWNI